MPQKYLTSNIHHKTIKVNQKLIIINSSHIQQQKKMSSLWNILAPIRSGIIKLNGSGHQMFGTVIQHGVNNKTVTVRVSTQHWNSKYKRYQYTHNNKQVHDQDNYCVTGDKVIIRATQKLSRTKAYYVKNIVKPFPRGDYDLKTPERIVDSHPDIRTQ